MRPGRHHSTDRPRLQSALVCSPEDATDLLSIGPDAVNRHRNFGPVPRLQCLRICLHQTSIPLLPGLLAMPQQSQLPQNTLLRLAPMHPLHREPHKLKDRIGRNLGRPKQSPANTFPSLFRLRCCAVPLCQTQSPPTRSGTNLAIRESQSPVVSDIHLFMSPVRTPHTSRFATRHATRSRRARSQHR